MRDRSRDSDSTREPIDTTTFAAVGRSTLTQRHIAKSPAAARGILDAAWVSGPVQLHADAHSGLDDDDIRAAAGHGIAGAGQQLPYLDQIQDAFGDHDVSGVRAHFGGASREANAALGANAYATGNDVAFANDSPSLHLVAHEAAHVVQQRAGVSLSSAVGQAGDSYEHHADAVADAVVRGESAAALLGATGGGGSTGVQRKPAKKPALDPRSKDPYLPHPPALEIAPVTAQIGKQTTLTVVDREGEVVEKQLVKAGKLSEQATYTWSVSGDPSAWKTFPTATEKSPRTSLKLEPKSRIHTYLHVEATRTTPLGNTVLGSARATLSIKDESGKEQPDWGKQDVKGPEVAVSAIRGLTEYLTSGGSPEIHPDYRYLYAAWKDAKEGTEKGGKSKLGDGRRTIDGEQWAQKIDDAVTNSGDVYQRAKTADRTAATAFDAAVKKLRASALDRQDYETKEAAAERQGATKQSIEATGFDGFCSAAGKVVEVLVPNKGSSAKLVVRGNFPLNIPGVVMFLGLVLEAENDSQYKFRGELNGGVTASFDAWVVEAFVQAKVFGYYEASGDTGAELFTMMKVAIVDGIVRYLTGRYGAKEARKLAHKIFSKEEVAAVSGAMDGDDYVEVGTGYEFSAGFATNAKKTPKNISGAGKFEQSDARKLTGKGDEFQGVDVERTKISAEVATTYGTFEVQYTSAQEGKDAQTEVSARAGLKVDLKELVDDKWKVALTTSIFVAIADMLETMIGDDTKALAILDMFRKPVLTAAVYKSPKLTSMKVEGKLGVKVGVKLGWSNGKFAGGEVAIASVEGYALGEEMKGTEGAGGAPPTKGIFVGYEAEEKLASWKIKGS